MKNIAPPILTTYSAEDHRRRLENIAICERSIGGYMRKHLVTSYIPGQCVYQLRGENFTPDKEDDRELAKLRENGIGLIQVWSSWWDNCWGGKPMYQSKNADGFRRLIDLVHNHGMKIIPYTSTNFFERTDPNFQPEWALHSKYDLVEHNYHLAHCSFASPGWREHVLASTIGIMDEFEVDGLYNDMGYMRPSDFVGYGKYYQQYPKLAKDEVTAFEENATQDGALQDMLGLIYAEMKRRGGIYKLHKEGCDSVHTDFRVYDYLWVGEAVWGIDFLRESIRNYDPYVVPEYSRYFSLDDESELYLNSIPYMQFPVTRTANTGGTLDSQEVHAHWLKHYIPMVEEGTWAWLDVSETRLLESPLPEDIVVSVFANRDLYLVIANFGQQKLNVMTRDKYVSVIQSGAVPMKQWSLEPRSFRIIRRVPDQE
ncbi:hypothetical protein ACFL6S_12320 [Candidatus Poribacteria bacterium]